MKNDDKPVRIRARLARYAREQGSNRDRRSVRAARVQGHIRRRKLKGISRKIEQAYQHARTRAWIGAAQDLFGIVRTERLGAQSLGRAMRVVEDDLGKEALVLLVKAEHPEDHGRFVVC